MKPTVSVRTKQRVFAGQRAELMITVDASDETKVDFIRAELSGSQGWQIGSGKSQQGTQIPYPDKLGFSLQPEDIVLKAGSRTEYQIAFDVPALVPPTHTLMPAWATLEVFVHVSIPWRIDVRRRFTLDVHRQPPAEIPRLPFAVRSNSQKAAPDAPRIELGVASRQVIAGEVLLGTVAVYHVDDAKEREVILALVPLVDLYGSLTRTGIPSRGFHTSITIPAGHAGRSVPFRMAIPKNLPPTFETITHAVRWIMTATLPMPFLRKNLEVEAPLVIHDATAAKTAQPLEAAPRLGDERMAKLFAQFAAEHGWRGVDEEPTDADGDGKTDEAPGQFAIEKVREQSTLRIAYDYRGPEGTFVMAGIRHPFFGLGLQVTKSSTVRHLMWRDIEVDIAPWDREHYVVARDEEQARAFLKGVVPSLMQVRAAGEMNHWNDHGIWFEQPVQKLDAEQLERVGLDLGAVAHTIEKAVASITPPHDIKADLPALAALADRYKARLCLGDLSLWSTPAGDPVHTELVRDAEGKPVQMKFWYGSEALASEALREKKVDLPHLGDVLEGDQPTELIEVLTGCKPRIANFAIERGVARCTLPLSEPAVDAATVRDVVDVLRAALSAVVPSSGPYR
ncbi:MAG TPA: hypothetical protein VGM90_17025 [Kofleriaceae bacterium]